MPGSPSPSEESGGGRHGGGRARARGSRSSGGVVSPARPSPAALAADAPRQHTAAKPRTRAGRVREEEGARLPALRGEGQDSNPMRI
eukprot:scaffold1093_cov359-Prasinococcus_capsulatus_cf.AAC.1